MCTELKMTYCDFCEVLLFAVNPEGLLLNVHTSVETLLGYQKDELTGTRYQDLMLRVNQDMMQKFLAQDNGQPLQARLSLRKKDGGVAEVESRLTMSGSGESRILLIISPKRDVPLDSEEKFFRIFDSSHAAMAIYDVEKDAFVDVNQKFSSQFGYDNEEIVGNSIQQTDIFHSPTGSKDDFAAIFRKHLQLSGHDVLLRGKSGELFHCLFSSELLTVNESSFFLISLQDVSKLKQVEQQLQHHLQQQKLIADISQKLNDRNFYTWLDDMLDILGRHTGVSRVYIFEDSPDGLQTSNTFEWCNKGILPQKDTLQDIPWEVIPTWKKMLDDPGIIFSKDIREFPDDIYDVLEPQNIKSLLVYPLRTKDNLMGFIGFDECIRMKEWTEDEKDLLKLLANILSNAFERRLMMERIIENESRLEWALNNAGDGVWDWDIQSGRVFFTESWCSMLGYRQIDLAPNLETWKKIVHPEDYANALEFLQKHLNGETEFYESTHRLKTAAGEWKWILDKGKVISFTPEGEPSRAIGKLTDLTEIKLAEEKLKLGLEKEKELNDLKSRFVSNASHEFRTPLASILITSDSLRQYWEKMDRDQIDSRLGRIQERVAYLTRIVNDVLELSRLQERKSGFNPEKIELVELCTSIIEESTAQSNIKSRIKFLHERPQIFIHADRRLLIQVINNLVSNAIKYSSLEPEITVKLIIHENKLELVVADNGIGIPEMDQKHLFEPFFRATNTGKTLGSGLGLNIVKESVAIHGGQISFESKPGKGTTFKIRFPDEVLIRN
ncbi:MAG: PAS domain S-box protein [Bacteroidales bacterium]|nr:PAS domain S-box protein [Bacteroidales bacterium]